MLLAGLALAALASSFIGILAYVSDDRQLRDLTFWSMGSLGGASWARSPCSLPSLRCSRRGPSCRADSTRALALREAEAFHLGVRLQRLKAAIVFLVAIAVGASVAEAGVISFVGIVAPHALRSSSARIIARCCRSASPRGPFCWLARMSSRTLVAPAEMPIGVLTAAIGAPFFLWLLTRGGGDLGLERLSVRADGQLLLGPPDAPQVCHARRRVGADDGPHPSKRRRQIDPRPAHERRASSNLLPDRQ